MSSESKTTASPEELWQSFRHSCRPRLEKDPVLLAMAREVQGPKSGPELSVFTTLAEVVFERVASFARPFGLPAAPGFYYEDPALAVRYSATQSRVLPPRTVVAERMAAWVWRNVSTLGRLRLLDLGTGDGFMAEVLLASRPPEVARSSIDLVVSDRSAAMTQAYRETFTKLGAATMSPASGDLTRDAWCTRATYWQELGSAWQDFEGFDAITCHSVLHLVPERNKLYAGVRSLLTARGVMAFSCDFLDEDGDHTYIAPQRTLLDGFCRYERECRSRGRHPITFVGYLAGFIFRRFFLQGDHLSRLSDEAAIVARLFPYCAFERDRLYEEFAVLVASQSPLSSSTLHADRFARSDFANKRRAEFNED